MTEKQFTDIEVGADTGRVRLYNGINFMEYSSSELLDLLNEQHETIQQLKQDKQQLYRIESRLRVRIKELEKENQSQSDAIDGLQEMMAHYNLEDFE